MPNFLAISVIGFSFTVLAISMSVMFLIVCWLLVGFILVERKFCTPYQFVVAE